MFFSKVNYKVKLFFSVTMGRMNRSRKRKDAMNRVKRERCEKREIARLKKVLGIVEDEGMDLKNDMSDIIEIKSAAQMKRVTTLNRSRYQVL